jgi:hypothetical protein
MPIRIELCVTENASIEQAVQRIIACCSLKYRHRDCSGFANTAMQKKRLTTSAIVLMLEVQGATGSLRPAARLHELPSHFPR